MSLVPENCRYIKLNLTVLLLTITLYISRKKVSLIIGINLAMENVIHKDNVKFPNFSQNAVNFPNSMGPAQPHSQKRV